jgi:hypothetical protein
MALASFAVCKNCKTNLRWTKGVGWFHIQQTDCRNPQPIKGTIQ